MVCLTSTCYAPCLRCVPLVTLNAALSVPYYVTLRVPHGVTISVRLIPLVVPHSITLWINPCRPKKKPWTA